MKTIRIHVDEYVEAKPRPTIDKFSGVCEQCSFGVSTARCVEAIRRTPDVFGGDCMERDVIYLPKEQSA
jgi:hypothetical protein